MVAKPFGVVGLVLWLSVAASADGGASDQIGFTWAPSSPEIGEVVVFEITGVPAADIEEAVWEFGGLGCDGTTSFVCTPVPVLCDAATFAYASAGTKTVTVTVMVGGVQLTPASELVTVENQGNCSPSGGAGLESEPSSPEIGETVLFTLTGFAGPVRTLWDFGEVGCSGSPQFSICDPLYSSCQQAVFRFASSGGKPVAVVAENPTTGAVLGTAHTTVTIESTGSCSGGEDDRYVLSSFFAAGFGGTVFHHEMELFNPTGDDALVEVDWLPRGGDNTLPSAIGLIPVPAGVGVRIDNVLDEVLGLAEPAIGALRLAAMPNSMQLDNLGLNSGSSGSFGWVIPSGRPSAGIASGEIAFILNLGEDDEVRSNLGCANLSGVPVDVDLELVDGSGSVLTTRVLSLLPFSELQLSRLFMDYAPVEGFVSVSHAQAEGEVACFGMVGFNSTSDFRSEPMQKAPSPLTTWVLPRAVHTADRTTDLVLFAPAGPAEVRLDFLPTGQDNTSYQSMTFVLGSQQQARIEAVLDAVFGATGSGALRVVATSGSVLASAAERSLAAGAEMHRLARVRPLASQLPAHRTASIIHLSEGPDRRTDLGVVNTSGIPIQVEVGLRDASGTRLGRRQLEVLPFSHEELQGVFTSVGQPDVSDGIARVSTTATGAAILAYAVVTDLATQDSWEVPAQELPAEIFADNFESGDPLRWDSIAP
jgi:hypothetical protein